jgi:hypothetical protein
LKDLDYFEAQKRESFEGSIKPIGKLIRKLELLRSDAPNDKNALKHDLVTMLKIALWGNKCDLSISSGASQAFEGDPEAQVSSNLSYFKASVLVEIHIMRVIGDST